MSTTAIPSRKGTKPKTLTPCAVLVREALAVKKELDALSSLPGQKINPVGYLRESVSNSQMQDSGKLKKLRQQIEGARTAARLDIAAALRRFVYAARSPNFPTPPKSARLLRFALATDTAASLAALGATPLDLFAVAAEIATEKHPEDFGKAESSESHHERLVELTVKLEQLESRIVGELGAEDLMFDDDRHPVSFALSGGAVTLAPRANAAKRLVDWALANEAKIP